MIKVINGDYPISIKIKLNDLELNGELILLKTNQEFKLTVIISSFGIFILKSRSNGCKINCRDISRL